jgi:Uma2 family endonuclease
VAFLLGNWAREHGLGRVLTGEAGLITGRDPDTVRGVDVLYFSYDRVPKGREPESFAETAPNLAVEIVGKGQGWKKMTEKAAEYLRLGADRAWIIDPRKRTLHVFRPDEPPHEYTEADVIRDDAALPGFSCKVADIFED